MEQDLLSIKPERSLWLIQGKSIPLHLERYQIMKTRFMKEKEMSSLVRSNHDIRDRQTKMRTGGALRCSAIFRGGN